MRVEVMLPCLLHTHGFRGGIQPLLGVSSDLQQPSRATVVG